MWKLQSISILILSSSSADLNRGLLLLAAYSLGLAIPFLLSALLVRQFLAVFARLRRQMVWVTRAAGVLLIGVGLLMVTDYFTVLAGKNHMGPAVDAAFDEVTPPRGPGGEQRWVRHLRERPEDKPFFMWFASTDAHREWKTTEADPIYEPADAVVPPIVL